MKHKFPGFVPETAFGGLEFYAELEAGGPAEEAAGGVDGFVEEVVGGDVGEDVGLGHVFIPVRELAFLGHAGAAEVSGYADVECGGGLVDRLGVQGLGGGDGPVLKPFPQGGFLLRESLE